ncbi:N-6 DNA methylase [Mycolicibacterium sarraceniae]|uniref:Type II restriction endonuclease subunit M n=1 Tax=Mycolicibacterium sarraceniae TaxID=1534348 RepID=A0A7I7SQP9_9MYCO|nr:N-6 DNA methylase [Mycolicibacterium sarraceniae]BBY58375.1 type II restriction endonuclease subunit M [Mycolicibacterium sarraceniae]
MGESAGVLLTPSEIADLAGVTRGAVTNWRKRPSDPPFPDPAPESATKPLYDLEKVIAWLAETKPEIQIQRDGSQAALSHSLNALRGRVSTAVAGELALALCCAKKLSMEAADGNWRLIAAASTSQTVDVLRRISSDTATDPRWDDILSALDDVERETNGRLDTLPMAAMVSAVDGIDVDRLAVAADEVLRRGGGERGRAAGYGVGEHGIVNSRVSELLSNLASSTKGLVYDPACGIAEALIRTRTKCGGTVRLVGHDINARAIRFARMRSLLHELDAEFECGDVLHEDPDPDLRADTVVAEPPFGMDWSRSQNIADPRWVFGIPPANNSELAWLQHAIAHLKPNGSAYVVTSVAPLTARGSSASIRAELLRSGWIEAVILLPPKMLPHTTIPLALWVLRLADHASASNDVLLIDASESENPEAHALSWLDDCLTGSAAGAPPFELIKTLDLLADDAQLDPRRWVKTPGSDPKDVAARLADSQHVLENALATLLDHAVVPMPQGPSATPRLLTVKELVQLDVASIQNGRVKRDDLDERDAAALVTPNEVRDGLPVLDQLPIDAQPNLVGGRDERTRVGDVLVTTWNVVRAVVDKQGGRLIGNGVYRLRVDDKQCEPNYVARCLCGTWNERFKKGATIQRVDLRELEIPLIPLSEQARLVGALREIEQLARQAAAVAEAAAASATAILDAVRYDAPIGGDE